MTAGRYYTLFLVFFCFSVLPQLLYAQARPSARFSFDKGRQDDEISGRKAKLVNVVPAKDRFGNEDYAVYISGSKYSYINLGTYKALKPDAGTISLWFNMYGEISSGKGAHYNPLILTKYTQLDDYYEAYGIYYFYELNKLSCVTAKDSTCQTNMYCNEPIGLDEWHHVVISYDTMSMAMFLDGKLQNRLPTLFQTQFLESDSVMVGHTANEKNLRFFVGVMDDIVFYDRVLSDEEVLALYEAPNPNRKMVIVKWMIAGLGLVLLLNLVYLYARYRVRVAVKAEQERSRQVNKALENELRVHRAMMNPHFIFNTLNGLQDFILKKANDEANDYLIKFSQLLRKIMESNMSDAISLELELDLLKRYIEMESMRFDKSFVYTSEVDPAVHPSALKIPIMMLQPFVENAIWHGLLNKEGEKKISMKMELYQARYLKCTIEDNGLGRKDDTFSIGKTSMATLFIRQRLDLINKLHDLQCRLDIVDKPGGTGTLVTILLPVLP